MNREPTTAVAAVDLGATSGRVMLGHVSSDSVKLLEAHRFPTVRAALPDGLYWDVLGLYADVLGGLGRAARLPGPAVRSIGVDSWAVDYGLLDERGVLLANPRHYRDPRTEGWPDKVHAQVRPADLYTINGLQVLPLNTLYQLASEPREGPLGSARSLLLIPDLIAYWLTGVQSTEYTNASTTGLVDVRARRWSQYLTEALGLPDSLLRPLHQPGDVIGTLREDVLAETGLDASVRVTAVGSHDTASAVVGVPAADEHFAYVCSGTWSLVGVELDAPVTTEDSRAANFTNEAGVDGTIRFLRNVMGFWMVQECLRAWEVAGLRPHLPDLMEQAALLPGGGPVIAVDDPAFVPPGDMPARIAQACRETGQEPPDSPASVVRVIIESMAVALAATVDQAAELSAKRVDVVHVVGGGARNALLCQLTADRCGRPVVAGPVEATSLGNILVQARALGVLSGNLFDLRAVTRRSQSLTRFEPRPVR